MIRPSPVLEPAPPDSLPATRDLRAWFDANLRDPFRSEIVEPDAPRGPGAARNDLARTYSIERRGRTRT